MTENLKTQQIQLLAKKSLVLDELKNIETALGQIAAILQFAEAQPAPETPTE
jgi:hypothetical protein